MPARITVVGLGPAGPELVMPHTRELIRRADVAFLRTGRHPAAAEFAGVQTFDRHYETAATFEEVYERIVADLVAAAQVLAAGGGAVVYAVPGSPLVAERTVEMLRRDPRVEVTVVPAPSFLDLAWARLEVDPVEAGVRLVDGTRFAETAAGERGPLLVAQCWSRALLSEIKLAVDDPRPSVGSVQPVTVLHHLGLPDEVVARVGWDELDRAVVPDHLTTLYVPEMGAPVAAELVALTTLVRRLRQDCPWDRQQTHGSLTRHLLEESYEVIDAVEALESAGPAGEAAAVAHLEEELGDLLFQVYFHSRLAAEEGRFTLADVAHGVHEKLVGRHPHVFGDTVAEDAGTVLANWEEIKKAEKGRESVTDGIPMALPALALAAKLQRKAVGVPGMGEVSPQARRDRALLALLAIADLAAGRGGEPGPLAVAPAGSVAVPPVASAPADELAGDLLWAASDLVRRLGVEPEEALRSAALRFADEVRAVEGREGG